MAYDDFKVQSLLTACEHIFIPIFTL